MTVKLFLLIAVAVVFTACSGSRALPGEEPLFPDATTQKWWLINAVTTDANGKGLHLCSLLSFTPSQGRFYTAFYTSLWEESGNAFYSGIRSSDIPFSQEKMRFPVLLEMPGKDSSELEWYWTLGRKRMRLQCEVKDAAGVVFPLTMVIKSAYKKPFQLTEINDPNTGEVAMRPGYQSPFAGRRKTESLVPMAGQIRLSSPWKTIGKCRTSVQVISSGEELIDKTKDRYISWVDLYLKNGSSLSMLYETDGKSYFRSLGHAGWDANGQLLMLPEPQFGADALPSWTSPASGKTYPTQLTLHFPEGDLHLHLRPRKQEQEIGAGKSALWMGAIEAVDPATGTVTGSGNMYILKQ